MFLNPVEVVHHVLRVGAFALYHLTLELHDYHPTIDQFGVVIHERDLLIGLSLLFAHALKMYDHK